jgi:hypothetical protein
MSREFLATQEMIGIPLARDGQMFVEPARVVVRRTASGEIESINLVDARAYIANADQIYGELQLTLGGEFASYLGKGIEIESLSFWEKLWARFRK